MNLFNTPGPALCTRSCAARTSRQTQSCAWSAPSTGGTAADENPSTARSPETPDARRSHSFPLDHLWWFIAFLSLAV